MVRLSDSVRDRLVGDDGTSVVMVGQEVLLLPVVTTLLLGGVDDGIGSIGGLTSLLVAELGEPPDGQDAVGLVLTLVQELALRDVLVTEQ